MKKCFFLSGLLIFLIGPVLTGCLKDKEYENGLRGVVPYKNLNIIEIEGPIKGLYNVDLIATSTDTTVENFVTVRLASDAVAANDIQVTLTLNPSLVDEYNIAHNTHYVVPSSNLYSIPSLTVTIPKGERRGYLKLTTRASDLIGPEYAIGVQLSSVSDPNIKLSGNYGKQVVAFAIRNKYDGEYSMTIKTVGWAAYGISSGQTLAWPRNVDLITASASSVVINDEVGAGLQPAFTSAGGSTFFGATTPLYSFDPVTDLMTSVINTTPDDGRGRALTLNPAVTDSRYDPIEKKIYASYLMKQNGRPDQEIYMVFTFVRPR